MASLDDWPDVLYRGEPAVRTPHRFTAIPYYLWNNREPGEMAVWLPEA